MKNLWKTYGNLYANGEELRDQEKHDQPENLEEPANQFIIANEPQQEFPRLLPGNTDQDPVLGGASELEARLATYQN